MQVPDVPDNVRAMRRPTPGTSDTPISKALAFGVNAPNPHNTQAWKFERVSDLEALLFVDEERLIPMTDPPARQIHIGCGCFIETAAIGGSGLGYTTEVAYLPEGTYPLKEAGKKPVARITVTKSDTLEKDEFTDYIFDRQTNRKSYAGPPVTDAEVDPLRKSFHDDSVEFIFVNDPMKMKPILDILYKAMEIECRTHDLYEESRKWFRFSEKERAEKRDGISVPQMGTDGLRKDFTEWYLDKGNASRWFSNSSINRYLSQLKKGLDSAQGIILLKTAGNDQLQWIKTGRAFARIALAATKRGLYLHPYSQVLQEYPEMTELQGEFNRLLGIAGNEKVQMALRVGRGERPYYAYRRRLPSFSE